MIVTLIDIERHIHTMQAKDLIKIFENNYPLPGYAHLWYDELHKLALKFNFKNLDQLLISEYPINDFQIRTNCNVQPIVVQAFAATKAMGYTVYSKPEHIRYNIDRALALVIWYNPLIKDSNDNIWTYNGPFKPIYKKLFYLGQLFDNFEID